jgi:ferric-dicitrate binding protein FerR (iron transport regulator)
MIDAKTVITKSVVEHAVEQAKGTAETALEDLAERVKDVEAVQQLRKKARKELKQAVKQVKKTRSARRSRRRGPRPVVLLLVSAGFVGLAVYVVQRRRNAADTYTAPDPFGEALEEERRAHVYGQPNIATPGA